jgi:fibronectin type 3 domain-containing protein
VKIKSRAISVAAFIFLSGLLATVNLVSENAVALNWTSVTLDTNGYNGEYVSIALDSNGYPHVSYYLRTVFNLRYASWNGSYWHKVNVDATGFVGRFTSIAMDSKDHTHISYLDGTNEDLKYAKWNGTSWSIEAVDSADRVGAFTSIAVDSSDHPHISYYDESYDDLKYARWDGLTWNLETVDSPGSTGWYTSIKLDSNDYPHISYFDASNGDLRYARWNGTGWNIQTVDAPDNVGYWTSLALDSDDHPHISYHDGTRTSLRYAKWNGTAWVIHTVDNNGNVGEGSSIALDGYGYPHMSYHFEFDSDLKYARWTGSSWNIETVDAPGSTGDYTSIVLDDNECRHIAYRDILNTDLKYAMSCPEGPLEPQSLGANAGDAQVSLSWSRPVDDGGLPITNYRIYRGLSSGGEVFLADVGNVLTHIDTGLANGQTYYYQVSAVNALGESPSSNEVNATPIGLPFSPLNPGAQRGNEMISLSWDEPAFDGGTPVANYRVYRGNASGGETLLVEVGNLLFYDDIGLTNGETYFYQISAVNQVGEGPLSEEIKGTPGTIPTEPTNLRVFSGDSYAQLDWDVPIYNGGLAIANYRVYRGTSSHGEVFQVELGNLLSLNDTTALNGITYYYQVSAVNDVGEGPQTNEVSTTPMTIPSSPTNVTAAAENSRVALNWSSPTDDGGSLITSYIIYRGPTSDELIFLIELGTTLSYSDTNVENDVEYYYSVSAKNSVGEGMSSKSILAFPFNQAPECTIVLPANEATVKGDVTVSGTASDADGTIQSVEIRIDEGLWTLVSGTTSWDFKWETVGVSSGHHTIQTRSYDGVNYSTLASVRVKVENQVSIFSELWLWIVAVIFVFLSILAIITLRRRRMSEYVGLEEVDEEKNSKEGEI